MAEYREAVRLATYDFTFRETLTRTHLQETRAAEAVREWKDFWVCQLLIVKASDALVKIYLDQHDLKSAIAELRRSLKASSDASRSDQEFVIARVTDMDHLAHLLTEDGQFEAAIEECSYLLRFTPDHAVLHNNLE